MDAVRVGVAPLALILLLPAGASAFMVRYGGALLTVVQRPCPAALAPSSSMLADAAVASPDLITSLQQFQDSHSILIATLSAIAVRVVVSEVRFRFERPVMDKVGERAREVAGEKARELTPNTAQIGPFVWAKLAACIALDLAGGASELYSVLGEFSDLAYAPIEAALLLALFKSCGMWHSVGTARRSSQLEQHPDAATAHRSRSPGLPCGPNQAPSPSLQRASGYALLVFCRRR